MGGESGLWDRWPAVERPGLAPGRGALGSWGSQERMPVSWAGGCVPLGTRLLAARWRWARQHCPLDFFLLPN